MPWLPVYLDERDAADLASALNADPDVAFVVSNGPGRWIARPAIGSIADGRYCIWHVPSGPLPLLRGVLLPAGSIRDPLAGWTESQPSADQTEPFFGGHPGVLWWNVRTHSAVSAGGIGLSSFEWIGNRYREIGSAAHPSTERWWRRLRAVIKRNCARQIPRTGPLNGPGAEAWAMPSALARIEAGAPRDADPL